MDHSSGSGTIDNTETSLLITVEPDVISEPTDLSRRMTYWQIKSVILHSQIKGNKSVLIEIMDPISPGPTGQGQLLPYCGIRRLACGVHPSTIDFFLTADQNLTKDDSHRLDTNAAKTAQHVSTTGGVQM
ncbi:uncharacterized protein LOC117321264 [Pecten maximus]|uniref:uncharacterized protein LOC117317155 n=1 Tax=Pecten maximus TaxID=6579 RepID=UPI001457FCA6|nr:uncharacterized protein LOC117317155 [Pecten maximus]XP_033727846.1 uncharacterized protein LOC117317155 [Pecten maximus]XP_033731622.1 uncharacterized protein LOC117321261 isoform X1 [Pecten maximus]XP_033731625.1 uncharacterized protein LOC117321264 [Pecten maximus]